MAKNKLKRLMLAGGTAASALSGTAAYAVDVNISGFVRQEIAVSVSDEGNPYNQTTNTFMGKVVPNVTNPGLGLRNGGTLNQGGPLFTGKGTPFDNGGVRPIKGLTATSNAADVGAYIGAWGGRMQGATAACVATGTCGATAASLRDDNTFNLFATRAEIDVMAQWTDEIKTFVKFRAFSDYSDKFNNPIGTPGGRFAADFGFYGQQAGSVLEWNSPSFMLDLPSAYIDINKGPLWVRIGQQQIAWGEAYFFRVFDVPNGLDTRRHFTLDVAAEEFSDKRVSAPAARVSYTFCNGFELDSFVQMSAPTTIVNTNTPYNVVANGFTWRDNGESDMLNNVNYGARLSMPLTEKLTVGAMAVNRVNPDGVVEWTDAPTTLGDGSPNPFCYGPNNYAGRVLTALGIPGLGLDLNQAGGEDVAELLTPMPNGKCGANASPDPLGTASYQEWFAYASRSRLNPMEGTLGFLNGGAEKNGTNASTLTTAIFGLAGNGFADPAGAKMILNNIGGKKNVKSAYTYQANRNILDGFFNGFAFPRGYITRQFYRETITGLSANYIVDAEPGSWLDQLIIRGEVSIAPNKKFTSLDLREGTYIEETDVNSALVLEKYHNVVPGLPATYLVAQWMHRTNSDLFGRHLSGNDHSEKADLACFPTATEATNTVTDRDLSGARARGCGRAKGQDSADYVAFAFQQPFPNLIWRADFAMLIDVQGGLLLQPGVKYKPSTKWQFDVYANILQDFTPGENDDVIETLDFADEIFARVSYYF